MEGRPNFSAARSHVVRTDSKRNHHSKVSTDFKPYLQLGT